MAKLALLAGTCWSGLDFMAFVLPGQLREVQGNL